MSIAADTREAVRRHPFLYEALRAGVVNYTAAARFLDVGDAEAVAAALRRYAADLPSRERESPEARVTMQSGLGWTDDPEETLLSVGGTALVPEEGSLTGVLVAGDTEAVDAGALRRVLNRLAVEGVQPEAAGVADGALLVVVDRRNGADALRLVEDAL